MNENGSARAASAALKVGESALALVARERKLTLEQLLASLAGVLLDAATKGDVSAAKELQSYAIGPMLRLGGARDSKKMFRNIMRCFDRGYVTLEQAAHASKLVAVKRALEVSNMDRRLRVVEGIAGTVIRESAEGHEPDGEAEQ